MAGAGAGRAGPVIVTGSGFALSQRTRRLGVALIVVTVAAVAVALKSFVLDPLTGHFGGPFEDFQAYLGAARSMAAGGSPYAQFDPSTVVMSGFDYPPFAAVVVRPLGLLGDRAAMVVWLLATLASAVAGAILVARTALPRSWPATELGVLAALAFAPSSYNFWHGQINPVVFLLLAVAFWAYVRERQVTVGVLLGFAAAIKIAPVIFLILLVRRRWWRGAGAMVATGLATSAIALAAVGIEPWTTFLTRVLPDLDRATGWIYNQSIGGAISRLADQSVLHVQPTSALVQVTGVVAALVVLGIAGWATRPGSRAPEERGVEFGLGITAMLLAGGIAWYPHFTHLLIPLFAVAGLAAARGWRAERSAVVAAAAVLVAFGLVAPAAIAALTIQGVTAISGTAAWWPFLQLCSLPCLCVAWLAAVLAWRLRREPVAAASPDLVEAPAGASG
ncbi:MAG: glycosyltransferase family 87 protein [Candidatus Dormibacteria bacterium]